VKFVAVEAQANLFAVSSSDGKLRPAETTLTLATTKAHSSPVLFVSASHGSSEPRPSDGLMDTMKSEQEAHGCVN
jgi:hypothetical protein